jgi:putative ABC transport system permease protein
MFKMRIVRSGFRTAWTHKVRSLFMVLSVMIGIAALTVIISLGRGTEQKITSQVQKFFSSNTIMIVSGGGKVEPNRMVSLTGNLKLADIEGTAQQITNVVNWDAVQRISNKEAQAGGNNSLVDISGHTPSAETVWNIEITSGRFFSDAENRNLARVAVIAPNVRQRLYGETDPVGQMIKIDNIPFQVIGVIGKRGLDPHGIDKDNEVLVPLNTMMRRVINLNYILYAKFMVGDEQQMRFTSEQIIRILREKQSLNENEADDFLVITPVRAQEMIKQASRMFNVYLPILAVVSLIVGGIVIVNLMLISVNERVKEIGLRKAVGARSKDIAAQFLIEASTITIVSGVVGMIAGSLIFIYIAGMVNLPPTISWTALIICTAASLLEGIAAGFFPAKRAANLSPIESLR